jgi:hypothetical protein
MYISYDIQKWKVEGKNFSKTEGVEGARNN